MNSKMSNPSLYHYEFRLTEQEGYKFDLNDHAAAKRALEEVCSSICTHWVFQLEQGGATNKWHFQGYLHLNKKKRKMGVVEAFKDSLIPNVSVRPVSENGNRSKAMARYCSKKDETYRAGPWTGDATWLASFVPRAPRDMSRLEKAANNMLPWQKDLERMFQQPPHERQIIWYYSEAGRTGKSTFASIMKMRYNAIVMTAAGRKGDILSVAAAELEKHPSCTSIIFDIPRSMTGDSWREALAAAETLKNGDWSHFKYKGGTICMNPPHLLVLANQPPPENWQELLSTDRLDVVVRINATIPEEPVELARRWAPGTGVEGIAVEDEAKVFAIHEAQRLAEEKKVEVEFEKQLVASMEALEKEVVDLEKKALECEEKYNRGEVEPKRQKVEALKEHIWKVSTRIDMFGNKYMTAGCTVCGHMSEECECKCVASGLYAFECAVTNNNMAKGSMNDYIANIMNGVRGGLHHCYVKVLTWDPTGQQQQQQQPGQQQQEVKSGKGEKEDMWE